MEGTGHEGTTCDYENNDGLVDNCGNDNIANCIEKSNSFFKMLTS